MQDAAETNLDWSVEWFDSASKLESHGWLIVVAAISVAVAVSVGVVVIAAAAATAADTLEYHKERIEWNKG